MSRSLASTARSMQANSLDSRLTASSGRRRPAIELDCTSESITVNATVELRSATLALIEEAMIRAGLKQDAMAAIAGVDTAQLNRGLREKDRKTFDPRWLDRQPVEFWIALHTLIGRKYGLTSDSPAELLLKDATTVLRGLESLLKRTAVSQ
jgi:hypothetical protein